MHLNELKALHVSEVLKQAEELEIENTGRMRKQELMFAIIKKRAKAGEQVFADGVLEILPDGFGFLRSPDTSFTASTDDIYISPSQVRRFNLHTGDMIEGEVRTPKDGERYFALTKLDKVNGGPPEQNKHKVMFENLTPLFPKEQMRLERDIKGDENITGRIIDIIAPIGRGQRALIVAPPKSGTRREELLLAPEILQKTRILRQFMYNMDEIESMELMIKNMKATKSNVEFFDMMRRGG